MGQMAVGSAMPPLPLDRHILVVVVVVVVMERLHEGRHASVLPPRVNKASQSDHVRYSPRLSSSSLCGGGSGRGEWVERGVSESDRSDNTATLATCVITASGGKGRYRAPHCAAGPPPPTHTQRKGIKGRLQHPSRRGNPLTASGAAASPEERPRGRRHNGKTANTTPPAAASL